MATTATTDLQAQQDNLALLVLQAPPWQALLALLAIKALQENKGQLVPKEPAVWLVLKAQTEPLVLLELPVTLAIKAQPEFQALQAQLAL
jgi:hypothetical protein